MDHREMPDERKQCCAHYECQVHPDLHAQRAALQIAAQSHLAERFVARPLGARDERWVGSDWMIPSVVGLISAMLMIGAASAAPTSDPSYLGNWARADGKTHIPAGAVGRVGLAPTGKRRLLTAHARNRRSRSTTTTS